MKLIYAVSLYLLLIIPKSAYGQCIQTNLLNNPAPLYLATGDLNGDNKPDILSTNFNNNNISHFTNNGNGGFSPATNFTIVSGNSPFIVTGDFNGDARLDVLATDGGNQLIKIVYNDGSGNFPTSLSISAGGNPNSAVTGDFNNDSRLDFAVTDFNAGKVSIFINNGSGFNAPAFISVGSGPAAIAAGDLNSDGFIDLVSANLQGNSASVLLNNGSGNFTAATTLPVGTQLQALAIGDFNGDSKPDFAVPNSADNTVTVYTNSGSGSFNAPVIYSVQDGPNGITAIDYNGDSTLDLVTSNFYSNSISILVNNGLGGFIAATHVPVGSQGSTSRPVFILKDDFNSDSRSDIAVSNANDNSISVILPVTSTPAAILTLVADQSGCPARVIGQATGTSFVFTGPGNYVYSNVFRQAGTYTVSGIDIKKEGIYTLTAKYESQCGVQSTSRSIQINKNCP